MSKSDLLSSAFSNACLNCNKAMSILFEANSWRPFLMRSDGEGFLRKEFRRGLVRLGMFSKDLLKIFCSTNDLYVIRCNTIGRSLLLYFNLIFVRIIRYHAATFVISTFLLSLFSRKNVSAIYCELILGR